MNMGGIGKGPSAQEQVKPLTDIAQKAAQSAKAGKIKSVKLKIKFGKKIDSAS